MLAARAVAVSTDVAHAHTAADDAAATLVARVRTALAGRYDVTDELGRGRSDVVLLGADLVAHRAVAIRVFDPTRVHDPDRVERWLDAARLQASLGGTGIVPVLDVRAADGLACCVMPLVLGASLATLHEPGARWSIDEVRWIVMRAGDALARLHAAGVVHGALASSTFLVDGRGDVLLGDVGTAAIIEDDEEPTLAQGDDQAALGRIAFTLLTGRAPTSRDRAPAGPAAALRRVRDDCPPPLAAAIMRMLAPDVADRWPTLAMVREAVRGTLPRDGGAAREALGRRARAHHQRHVAHAVQAQAASRAAALRDALRTSGTDDAIPPHAPVDDIATPRLGLVADGDGRPLMIPLDGDDVRATPTPRRRVPLVALGALALAATAVWLVGARPEVVTTATTMPRSSTVRVDRTTAEPTVAPVARTPVVATGSASAPAEESAPAAAPIVDSAAARNRERLAAAALARAEERRRAKRLSRDADRVREATRARDVARARDDARARADARTREAARAREVARAREEARARADARAREEARIRDDVSRALALRIPTVDDEVRPPPPAVRTAPARTTPPPATTASRPIPSSAPTVILPNGGELRAEAERIASTARLASQYREFFVDGDDHAAAIASAPTVINTIGGRVRAEFDVRLAKYDAAGRRVARVATVIMDVARDGQGTRATSISFGPLRRP